jgi:hypothetical protein
LAQDNSNVLFDFFKDVKENDQIFITQLTTNSTADKTLVGVINVVAGEENTSADRVVQHTETAASQNTSPNIDFKWGNINIRTNQLTINELKESFSYQLILYNRGAPVKTFTFEVTCLMNRDNKRVTSYNVKNDINDFSQYNKSIGTSRDLFLNDAKPGDMFYIDNITGDGLKFSLAIKII